jgi:hypothetical protein
MVSAARSKRLTLAPSPPSATWVRAPIPATTR